MKLIQIIFSCLLSINLTAQDCNVLNNLTSFHGLKLGSKIPPTQRKFFKKDPNWYSLKTNQLLPSSSHVLDYLEFADYVFQDMAAYTLRDSAIYSISLTSRLDANDSTEIANDKPMPKYDELINKISVIVGNYTRMENDSDENYFMIGRQFKTIWECSAIRIELILHYEAAAEPLNYLEVALIDKNLERKSKLEQLMFKSN